MYHVLQAISLGIVIWYCQHKIYDAITDCHIKVSESGGERCKSLPLGMYVCMQRGSGRKINMSAMVVHNVHRGIDVFWF